jgi:cobalt-zinc-cadmium efflux system membrane fusion protein
MKAQFPKSALLFLLLVGCTLAACSGGDSHDSAGHGDAHHHETPEKQTRISREMVDAYGIETRHVGAGTIREQQLLHGRIRVNAEGVRTVAARFPGTVRDVEVRLGQWVEAGQRLARIESSESLQIYSLSAPIAGVVTRRTVNPGELAGEQALFEIVDTRQVWAEFDVFPSSRARLEPGQRVRVAAAGGGMTGEGELDYLASLAAEHTQAMVARVVLDNAQGQWLPGQFVSGRVVTGEVEAAVVVPLSALQRMDGVEVVFVNDGDIYQAQPVTLGRRDHEQAEVTAGLTSGAHIAVKSTYLLKADIEKSAAEHEH